MVLACGAEPVACDSADAACNLPAFYLEYLHPSLVGDVTGTAIPPCTTCRFFVTASAYTPGSGFVGISGADGKCAAEAIAFGFSGTYRALIVDGTTRRACTSNNCITSGAAEHQDWVMHAGATYVQSDGVTVIETATANAVFTVALTNNITGAASSYWTGISGLGFWNWVTDPANNCSSWSDGTNASSGTYGVSSWTDDRAIAISSATATCDNVTSNHLLCVEQ